MSSAAQQKNVCQRLLNWGYTNLVYPAFEPALFRHLASQMRALENREGLSLKENQQLQWLDLQKLLKHAVETCPFYTDLFHLYGIRLQQIQAPADLHTIPPLTREDIRKHLPRITSRQFAAADLLSAATGGTTDTPVPIVRSRTSLEWKAAVQSRFNAWAGLLPGDKVFYLWGARQDYSENPSLRWRIYDRHLMRRIWAPTSLLNPTVLEQYRQTLNRFRPPILYAYPTPLALFCEYLRDCNKDYHRPTSVICTAESLYPAQRNLIEKTLDCEVFEHYGSREFAMIAGECERHNGMHYNPAAVYLEFVPIKSSESPDLCELLVTDLLNFGMPLIRYRVNDCTEPGDQQCACGRGYPLIRQIVGRTGDVFELPNGDRIPGVAFTNRVLKVCPGLEKTQIIQEAEAQFRIRYVPGPTFSQEDLGRLKANLRTFVPGEINWIFERVSEIPRERSGKTRFCVSLVRGRTTETPVPTV
jgi:phenylacetate-CoA ligase